MLMKTTAMIMKKMTIMVLVMKLHDDDDGRQVKSSQVFLYFKTKH